MLILTRKEKETIHIGDVRLVVTKIDGSRVRLGIKAPDGTKVLRAELVDRAAKAEGGER